MDSFLTFFEDLTLWQYAVFGIVVLVIWFLPAMLAFACNNKHAKVIAIACIPAGLSIIAWSALIIWAITGKVWDKYKDKVQET